jgi:hypothetical protein
MDVEDYTKWKFTELLEHYLDNRKDPYSLSLADRLKFYAVESELNKRCPGVPQKD